MTEPIRIKNPMSNPVSCIDCHPKRSDNVDLGLRGYDPVKDIIKPSTKAGGSGLLPKNVLGTKDLIGQPDFMKPPAKEEGFSVPTVPTGVGEATTMVGKMAPKMPGPGLLGKFFNYWDGPANSVNLVVGLLNGDTASVISSAYSLGKMLLPPHISIPLTGAELILASMDSDPRMALDRNPDNTITAGGWQNKQTGKQIMARDFWEKPTSEIPLPRMDKGSLMEDPDRYRFPKPQTGSPYSAKESRLDGSR